MSAVLQRVQANRLGFLEQCFHDLGLPRAQAHHRAHLAYSAYLGWFALISTQPTDAPSHQALENNQTTVVTLLTHT